MRSLPFRAIRLFGIVLSLALFAPFLQPGSALAAAPQLSLSKTVAVGTSAFRTVQTAQPGSILLYQLTYANTGNAYANPLTITDTLAAGQTLTSLTSGCTFGTTGGGLTQVTCSINNVPSYPTAGYIGAVYIQTTVNAGFAGTITNTAQANAPGATTGNSNTTRVNVGTPPPPSFGFTLQKFVADNGNTYGTSVTANPGDTLTYLLQFNNNTGATIGAVSINDTLAAGQTFLAPPYSSSCASYNSVTRQVNCTLFNVPVGTFNVYIQTSVQSGVPTVSNQATATANSATVFSNPTYVSVGQPAPSFTGSFTICGVLTGYVPGITTTGYMSFFGKTFTVAPGMMASGQAFTVGLNACFTFTNNNLGQIVAVVVTPNLTGVNVVCGVYSPSTNVYSITLSGYLFGYNGTFVPLLTPGGFYCFVVDNIGTAYIVLTNIPTTITTPSSARSVLRSNGARAL